MSPLIPYGYLLEAQQSQKTKERKEIEKERQKRNRVRMKTVLLREQLFNLFTKKLYTKRLLNLMYFI